MKHFFVLIAFIAAMVSLSLFLRGWHDIHIINGRFHDMGNVTIIRDSGKLEIGKIKSSNEFKYSFISGSEEDVYIEFIVDGDAKRYFLGNFTNDFDDCWATFRDLPSQSSIACRSFIFSSPRSAILSEI